MGQLTQPWTASTSEPAAPQRPAPAAGHSSPHRHPQLTINIHAYILIHNIPLTLLLCRGALLLQLLDAYAVRYAEMLEGRSEHLPVNELAGGARIRHIFQEIFVLGLNALDPSRCVLGGDRQELACGCLLLQVAKSSCLLMVDAPELAEREFTAMPGSSLSVTDVLGI